jgi:hypothetical protein
MDAVLRSRSLLRCYQNPPLFDFRDQWFRIGRSRIMNNEQSRAKKLLERCFTPEELTFLQANPEFVEVTRHLESLDDALAAIELGEKLVKKSWKRPSIINSSLNASSGPGAAE